MALGEDCAEPSEGDDNNTSSFISSITPNCTNASLVSLLSSINKLWDEIEG